MRIQHNIMAMNSYRNYVGNTSALAKNLEKLSSGYKINRAGDDAAGLAISEKMRAQITGLEVAQKNAKDGISLVQTAEGALTEVHDMLNRMVELADQSANGTYDDGTDRTQLQKEVDQLRGEIDRIADSANFNGIKLLDGSRAGATATFSGGDGKTAAKFEVTLTGKGKDLQGGSIQIGNKTFQIKAPNKDHALSAAKASFVKGEGVIYVGASATAGTILSAVKSELSGSAIKFKDVTGTEVNTKITVANGKVTFTATDATKLIDVSSIPTFGVNSGLQLQIGDTGSPYNQIKVGINDMHTKSLFLTNDNVNITTQDGAKKAVDYIRNAINMVSNARGGLGATQNRLDHTINNLSVMQENIQDAEAAIRDTDVAKEMMSYTKNNILIQSAQAMLAQANQVPQGVLQLLQ